MNVQDINDEILRLENCEANYQNCSQLAILYVIRNNMKPQPRNVIAEYSNASEFILAFNAAPVNEVLKILDEHMEAIKVLYPKEYSAIIKKIKEL